MDQNHNTLLAKDVPFAGICRGVMPARQGQLTPLSKHELIGSQERRLARLRSK